MRKVLSSGVVFALGLLGLVLGTKGCIFSSDSEDCGGVITYIHITNGVAGLEDDFEVSVKGQECQKTVTVPRLVGEFATLKRFGVVPGERLTFIADGGGVLFSDICDVPEDVAQRVNFEGDVVGSVSVFPTGMECLGEIVGEGDNPLQYIDFGLLPEEVEGLDE